MSDRQATREDILYELEQLKKRSEELKRQLEEEYNFNINGFDIEENQAGTSFLDKDEDDNENEDNCKERIKETREKDKKQLEYILNTIPTPIVIMDSAKKVVFINDWIKKIYGANYVNYLFNEGLENVKAFDKYEEPLPFSEIPIIRSLNRGEIVQNMELEVEKRDGSHLCFSASSAPIYEEDGSINSAIAVFENITMKKLSEKTLIETKEMLRTILDNSRDGIHMLELSTRKFTYINSALTQITGYSFEEMYNVSITKAYKRVHKSDYDNIEIHKKIIMDEIDTQEELKFRWRNKAGEFIWLSQKCKLVRDSRGKTVALVAIIRDITEQVKKDELIKQQNEHLNLIINNISDELILCDRHGNYTAFNKACRNIIKINESESMEQQDFFVVADRVDINGKLILKKDYPASRVGRGETFSNVRVDYRYKNTILHREVTGVPIYDSNGKLIMGLLISRDIAEKIKKHENIILKYQYDLLNRTIEYLEIPYMRVSYPDFKILYINSKGFYKHRRRCEEIKTVDEVIGRSLFETYEYNKEEQEEVRWKLNNHEANKSTHFFINRTMCREGKEIYSKVMFQPLYNSNNSITEVILIAIDITEEIKAKNKMMEELKIQDEIFANISHELRTPLSVIFSTNQLIEYYIRNGSFEVNKEKIVNNLEVIKQNCYRFTKIINNIVDASKMDSGFYKIKTTNNNIVEILENIVGSVAAYVSRKGINIIFDTNTEEKIIACDPEKIERVILNLISNAVKFTNPGGRILIEIIDKGKNVEIVVSDTGIGMDKASLDSIFKRFYQVDKSLSRNAEGCGIGLSVVKAIVELHGGKISVESEVDKGSTFKIELPVKSTKISGKVEEKVFVLDNKIEMINIEFSDIYAI